MRAATAKLEVYVILTAFGLLAALVVARAEPAVLAAPFGVMLVLGVAIAREPDIRVALELDRDRVLEGDEVTVTVVFDQPMSLLGIIGIDSVSVSGRGRARSVRGIDTEEAP